MVWSGVISKEKLRNLQDNKNALSENSSLHIMKCLQDISLKNKDDTPYYYRASIWSCLKAKKRMTLQNFYQSNCM